MAFSECGNLKRVTIPPSVTSIGDYAFRQTSRALVIHLPKGRDDSSYGWLWWCRKSPWGKDKPPTVKIDHRGTPRAR